MDAFYASVESRDNPELGGKPVAVGGPPEARGVVAAASYEARKFGVYSAMPMSRALRLCPELVIMPPDFKRYREASEKVMAILHSATALVEPLSLDEANLDVSENLWGEPLDMNVAKRIKQTIKDELQLTASAGVAPNKFLAEDVSEQLKRKGLRARTVTIKVRYKNFKTVTRSHTAEYFTDSRAEIVNRAQTLLERTEAAQTAVRLLGVGAHSLKVAEPPSP